MGKIKLGCSYLHPKGIEVLTQSLLKIKIGGVWVDGVTYMERDGNLYCRTVDDFIDSFTLIDLKKKE